MSSNEVTNKKAFRVQAKKFHLTFKYLIHPTDLRNVINQRIESKCGAKMQWFSIVWEKGHEETPYFHTHAAFGTDAKCRINSDRFFDLDLGAIRVCVPSEGYTDLQQEKLRLVSSEPVRGLQGWQLSAPNQVGGSISVPSSVVGRTERAHQQPGRGREIPSVIHVVPEGSQISELGDTGADSIAAVRSVHELESDAEFCCGDLASCIFGISRNAMVVHPNIQTVKDDQHAIRLFDEYHRKEPILLYQSKQSPSKRAGDIYEKIMQADSLFEACQSLGIQPEKVADIQMLRNDKKRRRPMEHRFDDAEWIVEVIPNFRNVFISGPTGTGKTQWAIHQFERPFLTSTIDSLREFDATKYDGIIFDDMSFAHYPRESVIHLLDWDVDREIHCRFKDAIIPARTRKIFTSNKLFEDVFPFDGFGAIHRRFQKGCIIYVTGRCFRPRTQPDGDEDEVVIEEAGYLREVSQPAFRPGFDPDGRFTRRDASACSSLATASTAANCGSHFSDVSPTRGYRFDSYLPCEAGTQISSTSCCNATEFDRRVYSSTGNSSGQSRLLDSFVIDLDDFSESQAIEALLNLN